MINVNDTTLGLVSAAVPLLIIGFLILRRLPWIFAFFVALLAVGLGYLETTGAVRDFGHKVRVALPEGIVGQHHATETPATEKPAEGPAMTPASPPAEPPRHRRRSRRHRLLLRNRPRRPRRHHRLITTRRSPPRRKRRQRPHLEGSCPRPVSWIMGRGALARFPERFDLNVRIAA